MSLEVRLCRRGTMILSDKSIRTNDYMNHKKTSRQTC